MISKLMRSTSVLAVTMALTAPHPVLAQSAEPCADGSEPVMTEGSDVPVCPEPDGAAEAQPAAEASEEPGVAEEAPQEEVAEEIPQQTEEAPAEEAPAEAAPAEAAAASEPVEEETTAETVETGEAGQDSAEAEAQSPVPDETAAEEATDAEEEPVAEATEEAAPAAEEEPAPVEETAGEAEPQDTGNAAAEAVEETDDRGTAETDAQAEPVEETADQAESAEDSGGQPVAEDAPAEETEAEQTAEEGDQPSEDVAADAETEAGGTEVEVQQDDTAESTAEANQPVETQAAQAAGNEEVQAENETTETVTEETTRSSGEEFETATQAAEGRDRGLSDFETFALGALGGAALAMFLNRDEEVVVSSQDRLVVRDDDGYYRVLKNDDALLRRPGVEVSTREFSDGSTRTLVTRQDGTQVVTIRAADGQVLRRTRILADGREVVLFDDTRDIEPVDVASIRQVERPQSVNAGDADALRAALAALENPTDRRYSLRQIRQIRAVRELVPEIDLDNVNFASGSAVISAEEAEDLRGIGLIIADAIDTNPNEVFLIEGHTDAVGGAGMNLALSDRRAESVALALTEYFDIPPENMVVQGYGESNLKVRTDEAERANRRVAVRKITPLLYARSN